MPTDFTFSTAQTTSSASSIPLADTFTIDDDKTSASSASTTKDKTATTEQFKKIPQHLEVFREPAANGAKPHRLWLYQQTATLLGGCTLLYTRDSQRLPPLVIVQIERQTHAKNALAKKPRIPPCTRTGGQTLKGKYLSPGTRSGMYGYFRNRAQHWTVEWPLDYVWEAIFTFYSKILEPSTTMEDNEISSKDGNGKAKKEENSRSKERAASFEYMLDEETGLPTKHSLWCVDVAIVNGETPQEAKMKWKEDYFRRSWQF